MMIKILSKRSRKIKEIITHLIDCLLSLKLEINKSSKRSKKHLSGGLPYR